jgi:SSS family solute:Na+ symporter
LSDHSPLPDAGLEALDYAAIAGYLALTFGVAVWFGRRQKNVDDFFVGGRRMPWFAVGLSILATLFSTITYLGMPGEMVKHGVGLFCGYLALPLNMLVIALLWIPFFMRLRVTSAYEYLERRFSPEVRLLGAALFVCLRLGWMSVVIYVASMAIDRIKGPDLAALPGPDIYWWIGFVGLFAAIYVSIGGIQALIWIDVLQCILLLSGVLLAIGYVAALDGSSPADWWRTAAEHGPRHTAPQFFSLDVTVRLTIVTAMINNFFWNVCTHGSDQVVLQRYFSTPSLSAARRSYFINVAVDLTMVSLLSLAGLALLAFYLRRPELLPGGVAATDFADKLFPHFLGHQLPAGCAGLVLSAFLCDAMQTLEAGVNSISAVAANDVVPRLRRGRPRVLSELAFARLLTVLITGGVSANSFLVAWLAQQHNLTIVDMMPKFFNMFSGPLAALFIVGMFVPRCSARSMLIAGVIGLTVSVLWSWWKQIAGVSYSPTILLAIAVPCLTTIGTAAVLSLLCDGPAEDRALANSWRRVVRGTM